MRSWLMNVAVPLGVFALSCAGAALTAAAEDGPKSLTCTFSSGQAWTFEGGKFQSTAPSTLTFSIQDINLEAQSATLMVDASHTGKLRIVRALNANSYLEVANEGFLNLTTIYDKDATSGTYPAVHSRHFGVLGQPMFAQYAGTCAPN